MDVDVDVDEVDEAVLDDVELAVEEDDDDEDAVDVADDDVESVLEAVVVTDSDEEDEVVAAEVDVDEDSSVVVVSRLAICTSLSSMITSSTTSPLFWVHRVAAHAASTCACSRAHPAWARQLSKWASSAPVCVMQSSTRAASPQVMWAATLSLWQGRILWWKGWADARFSEHKAKEMAAATEVDS